MIPKFKGKILILGVGNVLKQDDGAGPALVKRLATCDLRPETYVIDAGTAPENFTGKIRQIKPDTLVIVDAVDFGEQPGSVKIMGVEEFGVRSFSTHNVSLKTFVGFLKEDLPNLEVLVVGIQPKQVGFGEGLGPEVEKAVDELCMKFI